MSEANNGAAGIGAADIAGADAADETVIRIEDLRKTFGDSRCCAASTSTCAAAR